MSSAGMQSLPLQSRLPALQLIPTTGNEVESANEGFPHRASKLMKPKEEHAVSVESVEESSMVTPTSTDRKKLIFCFLGIFISYFIYGILQEKMWVQISSAILFISYHDQWEFTPCKKIILHLEILEIWTLFPVSFAPVKSYKHRLSLVSYENQG